MRLIDADALLKKFFKGGGNDKFTEGYNFAVQNITSYIELAPTIEAQPVKHGKWERTDMFVKCSECGVELLDEAFFGIHVFDDGYMLFCPNCGAKMDGGKEYG